METMRGRLALLDTQGAGLAERRSTICTGGPSLASRSWPTLHTDNWQLATDNFPVGLRSLRDLGPPYILTSGGHLVARLDGERDFRIYVGERNGLIGAIHRTARKVGLDGDELGYLLAQVAKIKREG